MEDQGASQEQILEAESRAINSLWNYSLTVLYPTLALKEAGLYRPEHRGVRLPVPERSGLGQHFIRRYSLPVAEEDSSAQAYAADEVQDSLVHYERLLLPLRELLLKEMLKAVKPYLKPDFRALDPNCGDGMDISELAILLPDGEVVGLSASARLQRLAFEKARESGVGNLVLIPGAPGDLPPDSTGAFDLIFSPRYLNLAKEKAVAIREITHLLRPGGYVFLADLAPPGLVHGEQIASMNSWSALDSGQTMLAALEANGFLYGYWEELLPGIGLILGMK